MDHACKQAKEALEKKLNRPEIKRVDLSEYERMIAEEVLDPEQLEGGFDTIGGLEEAKREVNTVCVLLIDARWCDGVGCVFCK